MGVATLSGRGHIGGRDIAPPDTPGGPGAFSNLHRMQKSIILYAQYDLMRIIFSLVKAFFWTRGGFFKVLASLELQTEAPRAQKNTLFSTEKYSHHFSLQTV